MSDIIEIGIFSLQQFHIYIYICQHNLHLQKV